MSDVISGKFKPKINYKLEDTEHTNFYVLANGIYSNWPTLAKTIPILQTDAERKYSARQESVRKDVERLFGVLMCQFRIIANPCRHWYKEDMEYNVTTCVILHNLVIDHGNMEKCDEMYQSYVNSSATATQISSVARNLSNEPEEHHNGSIRNAMRNIVEESAWMHDATTYSKQIKELMKIRT